MYLFSKNSSLNYVFERLLEMSNGECKVADANIAARLDELRMMMYRALEELQVHIDKEEEFNQALQSKIKDYEARIKQLELEKTEMRLQM